MEPMDLSAAAAADDAMPEHNPSGRDFVRSNLKRKKTTDKRRRLGRRKPSPRGEPNESIFKAYGDSGAMELARTYSEGQEPDACIAHFGGCPMAEASEAERPVMLGEYCQLLRTNAQFRWLFLAYLVNQSGNWVNYIASLALIKGVARHSSFRGHSSSQR
eukprot:SAG31_NODE_11501_length_1023_cov_1.457792_1_plen_160_part_10